MIVGSKRKIKIGQVYYDSFIMEEYTIVKISKDKINVTIQWNRGKVKLTIPKWECYEDIYIRDISSLEKELL